MAHSVSPADVLATLRAAGCVFAEDEADLLTSAYDGDDLDRMVSRRAGGTPLEHILGWADFCGVRITVAPGVFVPRRRTALLVHQARLIPAQIVVDICCGSGAVGAALAVDDASLELHCADIDPIAVQCARRNVGPLGGQVHEGDLYAALPQHLRGRVDIVVANAPYVPTGSIESMPSEARDHEPLVALDGGIDGLAVQRRVAVDAPQWLGPGGHLLIETSDAQAERLARIVGDAGFDTRVVRSESLAATVVLGRILP